MRVTILLFIIIYFSAVWKTTAHYCISRTKLVLLYDAMNHSSHRRTHGRRGIVYEEDWIRKLTNGYYVHTCTAVYLGLAVPIIINPYNEIHMIECH